MDHKTIAKRLPTTCPACREALYVQTLTCTECATRVEGAFPLPIFLLLTADEQQFILDFVSCSGSLKEMAARQGLSYPTVRNRLDEIIEHLNTLQHEKSPENC
ncbi:DUF2089 family protein [uncultured Alistipes sp.]|jgi:hypothetical protein|uniref:DUF2089 family protein n=1 Tax=uncultured Alistipes sp. TaxID=538949 RepID=UPI00266C6AC9|nr:DUF2089 family protein [uncultured Alistipes sp.]